MIAEAVARLGPGPLSEEAVTLHLRPLFRRALASGRIYLANHTLGRPLDQMEWDVSEGARLWPDEMRDAWEPWLEEEQRYRGSLAALLGMPRADAVIPKVSAGHALRTVLNTLPSGATVLTTDAEFASVTSVLGQYHAAGRLRVRTAPASSVALCVQLRQAQPVQLVVASQVFFADGRVLEDLTVLAEAAHKAGARLLVDSYHALGVLPFTMQQLDCDYMIGGCYKYLRGGPGAAFLAVSAQVLDDSSVRPVDIGWFAQRGETQPGAVTAPELRAGGDGWLEATPPVLTYYQARSGLAFTRALGVERLRAYQLDLLGYLQSRLAAHGIESRGGDPGYGAFLTVATGEAKRMVRGLAERGIVVDARDGRIRLCPDCLTTREELAETVDAVAALTARGAG